MTFTARIASASLFALASILSIGSAAATEAKPNPDPQLCAEYLRDLAAYRRMAEQLGCEIPQSADQVAATGDTQFPPVIADDPASSKEEFPPIVDEPVTSEVQPSFPPVVEASAAPAPADFPPVVSESSASSGSSRGSRGSRGGSSGFPPVETSSTEIPDESFEDPADPVRAAIEEKLIIFKEEAKARVKDAIIMKAEEVKERVKEKIKQKIEDAVTHNHHHNDGAPTLRRAAKNAVKQMLSERHRRGGSLLGKVAQLRRR